MRLDTGPGGGGIVFFHAIALPPWRMAVGG